MGYFETYILPIIVFMYGRILSLSWWLWWWVIMMMMMWHPRYELVHTSCLAIHKLSQLTNYLHIHPTKLQNMNQAWIFFGALDFCVSNIPDGNFPEHYDLVNLVVWQFNSSTISWCAAAYLGPTMLLMDRAAAPLRYKATCCYEWSDGGNEGCFWLFWF